MNRSKFIPLLLAMLLTLSFSLPVFADSPVSSGTNAKAQSILSWMNQLSARSTSDSGKALSGQFSGYAVIPSTSGDAGRWDMSHLSSIQSLTGETPAVLGCDYYNGGDTSGGTIFSYACNPDLKTHFDGGGLVTISHHFPNPFNPSLGVKPASTTTPYSTTDITAMISGPDCTGCAKERWYGYLWNVYTGLKDLQDKGVVVMYRPLHEMTGSWFWWGGLAPSSYKSMWNSIYDYMTNPSAGSGRVKLNNLIWVYAPDFQVKWGSIYDSGTGTTVNRSYTDYYPGNNRVDIVGLDAYADNPDGSLGTSEYTFTTLQNAYTALTTTYPTKPFAFAEMGPQDWGTAGALSGTYDFSKWLNALKVNYPKTAYWMTWNNRGANFNSPEAKFMPTWNDPTGGNTASTNYKNKNLYKSSYTVNKGTRLFSFENAMQSWSGVNMGGGISSVTEFAVAGSYSLKGIATTTTGSYYKMACVQTSCSSPTWNVSSYSSMKAVVKYTSSSAMTVKAQIYVKANGTYAYGPMVTLASNTAATVILPVSWIASPTVLTEIGVSYQVASGSGAASFYVDNVMAQ